MPLNPNPLYWIDVNGVRKEIESVRHTDVTCFVRRHNSSNLSREWRNKILIDLTNLHFVFSINTMPRTVYTMQIIYFVHLLFMRLSHIRCITVINMFTPSNEFRFLYTVTECEMRRRNGINRFVHWFSNRPFIEWMTCQQPTNKLTPTFCMVWWMTFFVCMCVFQSYSEITEAVRRLAFSYR